MDTHSKKQQKKNINCIGDKYSRIKLKNKIKERTQKKRIIDIKGWRWNNSSTDNKKKEHIHHTWESE